jgi:hypothetical protein
MRVMLGLVEFLDQLYNKKALQQKKKKKKKRRRREREREKKKARGSFM